MFRSAKDNVPGHVTIEAAGDGPLTVEENKELKANVQLVFSPEGISEIRYQWQSSADGKTWAPIPDAVRERFTPSRSESGLSLRVLLTFILIDALHSEVDTYSDATQPVAAATDDVGAAHSAEQLTELGVFADDVQSGGAGADTADDGQQSHGRHAGNGVAAGDAPAGDAHSHVLYQAEGSDTLHGGGAADRVVVGSGHHVFVPASVLVITGTEGDDTLVGSRGNDIISGLGGNDHLFGGAGRDIIHGGVGNDVIDGGAGNDIIAGDQGDDQIVGDIGDDVIYGGSGIESTESQSADIITGGDGSAPPAAPTEVAAAEVTHSSSAEASSDPSAALPGDDGNDVLDGGAGNDIIYGGSGHDAVDGGSGHDVLHGDSGNDVLAGGTGNDLIYGGSGNDNADGGDGQDAIHGDAGNDVLAGSAGNDVIYGGTGDDHADGGSGQDTLHGDDGNDTLAGGADNDMVSGGSGCDTVSGDDGDDTLAGNAGDDAILGGSGNDKLYGGDGDSAISGDDGNDRLVGGDGNDTLSGGSGNDIIDGGAGDDILYGGSGHDVFVYHYGDGNDSIMDFEFDADDLEIDGDGYSYTDSAYGRDYIFKDGAILAVHSNSGKGSSGSGSSGSESGGGDGSGQSGSSSGEGADSHSGGSGDLQAGSYDYIDDEFDYSGFGNQSVYESPYAVDTGDDWSDLIATGVIDAPVVDVHAADDYAPLSAMYDDPGLHAGLGISMIPIAYDDHNLFA